MKSNVFVCNHQIFLSENQRYDLFACIPVIAQGIYIQAEIIKNMNAKNIQEVFCVYEIDCKITKKPIEIKNNIIKIHIQQIDNFQQIIEEFELTKKNKFKKIDEERIDMKDILNSDEGGKECLFFETISTNPKKNSKHYHKVELKDIQEFNRSVEFVSFSNLKESY